MLKLLIPHSNVLFSFRSFFYSPLNSAIKDEKEQKCLLHFFFLSHICGTRPPFQLPACVFRPPSRFLKSNKTTRILRSLLLFYDVKDQNNRFATAVETRFWDSGLKLRNFKTKFGCTVRKEILKCGLNLDF